MTTLDICQGFFVGTAEYLVGLYNQSCKFFRSLKCKLGYVEALHYLL